MTDEKNEDTSNEPEAAGVYVLRNRPAVLNEGTILMTACHLASIMGPCTGVGSKSATAESPSSYPLEVSWSEDSPRGYGVTGDFRGVWLSSQGVFVSHAIDQDRMYQIIGYCAYQGIPFFTENDLPDEEDDDDDDDDEMDEPLFDDDDAAHKAAVRILAEASKRPDVQALAPEEVAHALMHYLARMMITLYHHTPGQIADQVRDWAQAEADATDRPTSH